MKERYRKAEARTDSIVTRIVDSPWTLAILSATHGLAFVLGALLFGE